MQTAATVILIGVLVFLPGSIPAGELEAELIDVPEHAGTRAEVPTAVPSSLDPRVQVVGGSSDQRTRLALALDRFREAGLTLPDLTVVFTDDAGDCYGHIGWFQRSQWTISICDDLDFVYEHELAHAWEAANLDDETREAFMEQGEYQEWSSRDVPWNQRAMEGVAVVIQQGLGGYPFRSAPAAEQLEAFELLTGRADPRLAAWQSRDQDG